MRYFPLAALVSALLIGAASAEPFVKASPPAQCLSLYPNVYTPKGTTFEHGLKVKPSSSNTTVDLRGKTIFGMASKSDALSVVNVSGHNNVCMLGGRLISRQDPQVVPWVEGHAIYGAGLHFKGGKGDITVENIYIANSLQDGITVSGSLPASTTLALRGSWITNTSDDGIQNDGGKVIRFIEDSLIEAKMGLSIRPGADSDYDTLGKFVVPIRNTLLNIICVADDRPDGSDKRNPAKAQKNNCGPLKAAAGAFKWSAEAAGITVDVRDTIIRYEARNRNGWKSMNWPKGTYSNVVVVWDPRVKGMKYEGAPLPPGVTLTTDTSVWTEAKAEWLRVHGCASDGACTFP